MTPANCSLLMWWRTSLPPSHVSVSSQLSVHRVSVTQCLYVHYASTVLWMCNVSPPPPRSHPYFWWRGDLVTETMQLCQTCICGGLSETNLYFNQQLWCKYSEDGKIKTSSKQVHYRHFVAQCICQLICDANMNCNNFGYPLPFFSSATFRSNVQFLQCFMTEYMQT